jgi:hypothetical protein
MVCTAAAWSMAGCRPMSQRNFSGSDWQTATLLRGHHEVVGWVRPAPTDDGCTWYGEDS